MVGVPTVGVPGLLALAVVATAVTWKGSEWLEEATNRLAAFYGVPAVVQGAVIAAVGSSFPELASVVLAAVEGEFELGVASVVGSAVFNLLVIPPMAALAGTGQLTSNRDLVYKEAQFYMLSVAVLFLSFSFAVIYYPLPEGTFLGSMNRLLALFPLALYALYLFIQYLDTVEGRERRHAAVDARREWLRLAVSLAVIVVGVEGLVRAAIGLGEAFGTPSFLWGLTVVAAGTSLPDAVVSVKAARAGKPTVSLANVLGSNVFDLLVAVPAGVLLAGAMVIDFAHVVPMMAFLVVSTVVVFGVLRTDMELTRREAHGLLVLYGAFVAWLALESVGVTALVR